MLFKLSNLNSNLVLTLGYLNPALNNSALASRDIQFYQSLYWPFSNLINFHFRMFD